MLNYKTIEEKAIEWNLSSRHIQHLCRSGKIAGAIKRAGSWFIPDDTPSPAQHSKSDTGDVNFVGTKKRVFDSAIDLFVRKGYDGVSLRDIAKKAGIRQSTIYNHFSSKQEILDSIYNFYCHYYLKDRTSLIDMERIIQSKSIIDVIGHIQYAFKLDYREKMSDITKIILQRIGTDERARDLGKRLMVDEGIHYVEDVFNKMIENGRLAPFDVHAMAVFINSVRMFTLYNWIIDPLPDNMTSLEKDEKTLYNHAVKLLTDLKPVSKSN